MDSKMRDILAGIFTVGYFAFLVLVMFKDLPADGEKVIELLMAIMSTAEVAIIQFYFGSSAGSAMKDRLLASTTPSGSTPAPAAAPHDPITESQKVP